MVQENLPKPARRGRYELLEEIANGAAGRLWALKFDHAGRSLLALGRLTVFAPQLSEKFRADLASAAWQSMEVDDPGVCKVADVLVDARGVTTVYNYVEGETLSELQHLQTTAVSKGAAVGLTLDLAQALCSVHSDAKRMSCGFAAGGIHPTSILVGADGRAQLLDTFVSAALSRSPSVQAGTDRLRTLAPEQLRQEQPDERTDVFSLGCILWELLANRRMHDGSPQSVRRRVLAGRLPHLPDHAQRGTGLTPQLVEIVGRCLELRPSRRFQTVDELRGALMQVSQPGSESEVAAFLQHSAGEALRARRRLTGDSMAPDLARVEVAGALPTTSSAVLLAGTGQLDPPRSDVKAPLHNQTLLGLQSLTESANPKKSGISPGPPSEGTATLSPTLQSQRAADEPAFSSPKPSSTTDNKDLAQRVQRDRTVVATTVRTSSAATAATLPSVPVNGGEQSNRQPGTDDVIGPSSSRRGAPSSDGFGRVSAASSPGSTREMPDHLVGKRRGAKLKRLVAAVAWFLTGSAATLLVVFILGFLFGLKLPVRLGDVSYVPPVATKP